MIEDFLSSGTLNIVYAVSVFISLIFAVITLIGAEAGDILDLDVDADTDSDFDFVNISPFALAMFGATFGATGLITRLWFSMETVPSVLWSTGIGLAFGAVAQAFFIYVLSPSKSSHLKLSDEAVGREAEVIITIPSDGRGTVAFDSIGGRITLGARSGTGKEIGRGEIVMIERIIGRLVVVHPVDK